MIYSCLLFFSHSAKGLLERMNALETYPPFNNKEAADLSASSAYAHVKSYSRGRTCGTLSKYEWEASCKCIVFDCMHKCHLIDNAIFSPFLLFSTNMFVFAHLPWALNVQLFT